MVSSICILKAVTFLDLLAVGLIIPFVPIQVRKMGGNLIHTGLLGSIYAGFQLVSGPLIGSLSDLKGRKSILIGTLLVCSVAYTVKGFSRSIYLILFIRAVLGVFKQTQMLARAMVPDYERNEQKQGEIYGKMMAISSAGMTLGPVFGGHILEDYPEFGFTFIALAVGLCFVANAVLISILPSPMKKVKRKKTYIKTGNFIQIFTSSINDSFLELYNIKWSLYGDIFMFKGLVGFAMGVYYSIYASLLKEQFDLTPKYIAYIISFQGIVGSFSSFFISFINNLYKHDKDYSQRNFHVFLILTISLLGLIFSYNVYFYTIWLIPLAVGNAIGRVITLEMVLNRSHGDHRGKLIGASNSVRALTGVISPVVAGAIGEYYGVTFVIYASLLSTSLGVVLSYQHRFHRYKYE